MSATIAKKTHVARRHAGENRVRTASRNGQYHLIAVENVAEGESLMRIDGDLVATPCRYSVQVGSNIHIAPPAGLGRDDMLDRFVWRFLNHSCKPNCMVVERVLIAITDITDGDEVTIDYNANELDMAAPFTCHCGHCGGAEIRGYRHLSSAQRTQRRHYLAEYLRSALDQTTV